jgi:hypothetical protein
MTELEKLNRAKMYLDKLANGIDPITDTELPSGSALNQVRLARCFSYVSDILRQVIENGGAVRPSRYQRHLEFNLPAEKRSAFVFSGESLHISEFLARLNDMIDADMKKLSATAVTSWLLSKGFLAETENPSGRKSRLPTKQGEQIGLSTERRQGQNGEYRLVLYNEAAQRFILDNLDAILQAYGNKGTEQPEA